MKGHPWGEEVHDLLGLGGSGLVGVRRYSGGIAAGALGGIHVAVGGVCSGHCMCCEGKEVV